LHQIEQIKIPGSWQKLNPQGPGIQYTVNMKNEKGENSIDYLLAAAANSEGGGEQ
jgi:hypothetical protein